MKVALTIATLFCQMVVSAQSFTPGNLVVERFGDGVSTVITTKTVAVFLDEYTPAGVLVRSIPMPVAVSGTNRRLAGIGSNNYQGSLYRSADGQYLTLMGYDSDVNVDNVLTSSTMTVNRIVGLVSYTGTVNTSTAISAAIDIPRAAVTANGYQVWVGGSVSNLYYAQVGNGAGAVSLGLAPGYRSLAIVNNQLYATSSGSTVFRIGKIGSGLPTSGTQTVATLPGIPTTSGSPNQVAFFDTNGDNSPDLLYYADDAAGAIVKYALSGSSWVAKGSSAVALMTPGVKGITGSVSSGIVTLYAVTFGNGSVPSRMISFTDSVASTLTNSKTISAVVNAPSNTSFRGIAFAPVAKAAVSYPAVQADEFIDRIGVNTHPPTQRFKGVLTPHADTVTFKARLAELGVKHIRVNVQATVANWAFWNGLHAGLGVKMLPIMYPSVWTSLPVALSALRANVSMMEAVEGPNETDGEGISYNGQTYPLGTIAYQNDLYDSVKADLTLQHLPVLAPTAGNPVNYPLFRGAKLDVKNIHYYAWNLPADHIEGQISNADSITTSLKPIWTTETGYSTYSVSEKAQGKYMPRLLCEFFNRGIYRSYIYQLVDRGTDTAEREHFFGICRNDWSRKPAFNVMKNLIATLKDSGAAFTPTPLTFTIDGDAANVKTFVLQKRNGDHYLLIWNDVAAYHTPTKADLNLPAVPVSLKFTTDYSNATIYQFSDTGTLSSSSAATASYVLNLSVNDKVQIIKLPAGSSARAASKEANTMMTTTTSVPKGFTLVYAVLTPDNELKIRVNTMTAGKGIVQLANMAGQQVFARSFYSQKGDQLLSFPATNFHTGVYGGTITFGNERAGFKILK